MNVKPDFSKNRNVAETAPAFLSVYDMHAYYGESYIIQGISFNVHEGEILALLGRNGAGKTTTLKAIMGMVGRRSGSISFKGNELVGLASNRIARTGTRSAQGIRDASPSRESMTASSRCEIRGAS